MQGLGDVAREIAHGVHVHGWSAATLVVPTGELRRECSLQGRRMWPQASSNPPTPRSGVRVGLYERHVSKLVVLDSV